MKIFKGGILYVKKHIYTFNVMKYVFIFLVNGILDWKRIMIGSNNLLTLENVNVYYGRKKQLKMLRFPFLLERSLVWLALMDLEKRRL